MKDSNVVPLHSPAEDALQAILEKGAQELLAKVVEEAELLNLLSSYEDQLVEGKQAVVRNGYLPERTIQTGLGCKSHYLI